MPNLPDEVTVRLHAIVHGYVQGVTFRATTQREAARRKLTGWVRNRWDGTVETVADVEQVDLTYSEATGEFRGFNIRY